MTKKISCRVIDSVPLSDGESNLHLGWTLDARLYAQTDPSLLTYNRRSITCETQLDSQDSENIFDCYA